MSDTLLSSEQYYSWGTVIDTSVFHNLNIDHIHLQDTTQRTVDIFTLNSQVDTITNILTLMLDLHKFHSSSIDAQKWSLFFIGILVVVYFIVTQVQIIQLKKKMK